MEVGVREGVEDLWRGCGRGCDTEGLETGV